MPQSLPRARLLVADVLKFEAFADSDVVAGRMGVDRPIRQVNVMQIPTDRFAKADELVLAAGSAFVAFEGDRVALVEALADRGVAALAIRGADPRVVLGQAALQAADARCLPVIELPPTAHLGAIQTAVLETIVTTQATQLRRESAVRDRIAGHVLSGGDLTTLPVVMAETLRGDVVVLDAEGVVLAASPGADAERARAVGQSARTAPRPKPGPGGWVMWPVMAGERRLGSVVAHTPDVWDPVYTAALEHGTAIAALEILNRLEAAEADGRFRAGFVRDLLSGSLDSESGRRRAAAVGWRVETEFRAIIAEADTRESRTVVAAVRDATDVSLVTQHAGACLAVIPCLHHRGTGGQDGSITAGPSADPIGVAEHLTRRFPDLRLGISARHVGLEALPIAVSEAREALRAARVFTGRRIHVFERLGVLRLLSDVPREELIDFGRDVLGPLDSLADTARRPLQETLELLLDCDLNVAETARRGGWHYNTVRYRVVRLTDLLGPFTADGTILDSIQLALLLRLEIGEAPT
jgi:PucR family transcriptional regulator, purine catabolism regulatory protein